MEFELLNKLFSSVKSPELFGRYITNSHIQKCIAKLPKSLVSVVGYSVEKRPIYSLNFGNGPKKVLLWSQMHGNESTTTKALFDCFNLFLSNDNDAKAILESCSLVVIPILNPDGAERYTRFNANDIDLNRDAQGLSQPESKVLRKVFNEFKPDYCFNLHGQRTIYNVGGTNNSSILSFLSPSQDLERTITDNRKVAMQIIVGLNSMLQQEIPNNVARYDDGFNINCVGDMFQSMGVPTLLYEAGHYPDDYNREEVRRLVFASIIKGLQIISDDINTSNYKDYFLIPENEKKFYDIIIRNYKSDEKSNVNKDIAILYKEELVNGKIEFVPVIESISDLSNFYGHKEIDVKDAKIIMKENSEVKVTNEIDFVMINDEKILLKP